MNKIISNRIKKVVVILATMLFGILIFTNKVDARSATDYWWSTTIDIDDIAMKSNVLLDSESSAIERTYNPYLDGNDHNLVEIVTNSQTTQGITYLGGNNNARTNLNFIMSWPGSPNEFAATDVDYGYAQFVANNLTNGVNVAASTVMRSTGLKNLTADGVYKLFADVGNCMATDGSNLYYLDSCNKNFTSATEADLSKAKITLGEGFYMGFTVDNFKKVRIDESDEGTLIMVSAPKGYDSGQYISAINGSTFDYSSYISAKRISSQIEARDAIAQAINTSKYKQIYSPSGTVKQDGITKAITGLFSGIISGIESALGLYDIRELIFNEGMRSSGYYKGVSPAGWFSSAAIIFWICQVVVVFMMAFSLLTMFIQRGATLLNPSLRASFKAKALDFCLSIVIMVAFQFIFWGLCELNYQMVDLLSSIPVPTASLFKSLTGQGIASLGDILIAAIYLFISISLNVTYLLRSVVILLLYITAPIFIALPTFGKTGKALFKEWGKELIGNIFMQTLHALILCIFLVAVGSGSSRLIERMILCYSFLPLTKLYKEKFLGSSMVDKASDGITKSTMALGGAALGGLLTTAAAGSVILAGGGSFKEALGGMGKMVASGDKASKDVLDTARNARNNATMSNGSTAFESASGGTMNMSGQGGATATAGYDDAGTTGFAGSAGGSVPNDPGMASGGMFEDPGAAVDSKGRVNPDNKRTMNFRDMEVRKRNETANALAGEEQKSTVNAKRLARSVGGTVLGAGVAATAGIASIVDKAGGGTGRNYDTAQFLSAAGVMGTIGGTARETVDAGSELAYMGYDALVNPKEQESTWDQSSIERDGYKGYTQMDIDDGLETTSYVGQVLELGQGNIPDNVDEVKAAYDHYGEQAGVEMHYQYDKANNTLAIGAITGRVVQPATDGKGPVIATREAEGHLKSANAVMRDYHRYMDSQKASTGKNNKNNKNTRNVQ